jgi:hypothetical protein
MLSEQELENYNAYLEGKERHLTFTLTEKHRNQPFWDSGSYGITDSFIKFDNKTMEKKTILKMQVQDFGDFTVCRVTERNREGLLQGFVAGTIGKNFHTLYTMEEFKQYVEKQIDIQKKNDEMNAKQPTKVWRECWNKTDGELQFYINRGKTVNIKNSPITDKVQTVGKIDFNMTFNLYPDLSDGKVHTWEINGVKFEAVKMFGCVKFQYVAGATSFFFKPQLLDKANKMVMNPCISIEDFAEFYEELQEYKYANQAPSPKYEVVWTEEKPPTFDYLKPFVQLNGLQEWFSNLGIKLWECEVRKL